MCNFNGDNTQILILYLDGGFAILVLMEHGRDMK